MSITVVQPGLLTTVQDAGRTGHLAEGMTASGVMDRASFEIANRLVGNVRGSDAVLECTMVGPVLHFDSECVCAIAGADMQASVQGIRAPRDRAFIMLAGQTLSFSGAVNGCRAYLAVRGGIDVPMVMGSRSTSLKCGIGGHHGRALKAGDRLPVGGTSSCIGYGYPVEPRVYADELTVRAIPGPQEDCFSKETVQAFYAKEYTVGNDSDRMGLRLQGTPLNAEHVDIVSDGIVFGSVQVPHNGQPIILMADHQTTGGYAKIATVCSVDLPLLAQCRPGCRIHFRRVTVRQAQKLLVKQRKLESR